MITDYQIILIIITILTIIISIALYTFFVYIPASRAAAQVDVLVNQGESIITTVNNQIENVREDTTETLNAVCRTICLVVHDVNEFITIIGCEPLAGNLAVPAYCPEAFKDVGPGPTFCGGVES